jgi:signal transduction histidine kinase
MFKKSDFVEREGISSRVIIRLEAGDEAVGILFFNFRRPTTFERQRMAPYYLFANLAALAIQRMQSFHQDLKFERESLAANVHDFLKANIAAAEKITYNLLDSSSLDPNSQTLLKELKATLNELRRDVDFLDKSLKDYSFTTLRSEVEKLSTRIGAAYGPLVNIKWVGERDIADPSIGIQCKLIVNEGLVNAIRHSEASHIDITIQCDDQLCIEIKDNGKGLSTDWLDGKTPGGLISIKSRAESIGGTFEIISDNPQGTHIRVIVPSSNLEAN